MKKLSIHSINPHIKAEHLILYALLFLVSFYFFLFFGKVEVVRSSLNGIFSLHVADDHMITMRVADNFSKFGFPFFNKGEPVAANTSLFWPMILGSTIMKLGLKSSYVVVLNVLISITLSAASIFLVTCLEKNVLRKFVVALLLCTSSALLKYGNTGWEHIPQMFFITLGFVLIISKSSEKLVIPNLAFLFISLSFLFRPDSAILIFSTGIAWFFFCGKYRQKRNYLFIALISLIPIAYLFLMQFFYGDWVPNTAHLKVLGIEKSIKFGISYILNPEKSLLAPYLIFALLVFRPKNAGARLFVVSSAFHLLYVVLIGGDVFMQGRFFLLVTPVLYTLAAQEVFRRFAKKEQENLANTIRVSAIFLCCYLTMSVVGNIRYAFLHGDTVSPIKDQLRIADWINHNISPEEGSIGLHWLGIAYHLPDFHVVDFLGKAEKFIARTEARSGPIGHNKWDYEYAFKTYNISVIPMPHSIRIKTTSKDYVRNDKQDFLFWNDAVQLIESSGDYTYYRPSFFGGEVMGAYIRNDIKVQE